MVDFADLEANLNERKQAGLFRERSIVESAQQVKLRLEGRDYLNFCSNDYLGLANHPDVVAAVQKGVGKYGVGSGASHLVSGHGSAHHQLEQALAEFTGRERALLFSNGYMANIGCINALLGRDDAIFEDRLNHASLIDGGLSSGARFKRYPHGDMRALNRLLEQSEGKRKLVVSDGVFSMDGDLANIPALVQCCEQANAWLMIDDAHGFGCLGKGGRGSINYYAMSNAEVPILVGTLGKAFGTFGAFVAGSELLIETLIQNARTYIYTTALPPALAMATLTSLKLLQKEQWRRDHLIQLVERFRLGAAEIGLHILDSMTPIQPIILGDSKHALAYSNRLREKGFLVTAIRPPTVPSGSARLRVTFTAEHSLDQVDLLLGALADIHQTTHDEYARA